MKVLMVAFVYNEINYISQCISYYKKNNCEIYIIDNYSNDGTYEWLIENNIPCHRINTDDSFDLRILSDEVILVLHKLKPDWVILGAADLYHIPIENTLLEYIKKIDSLGFNQISAECLCVLNTGETFNLPLSKYYFYAMNNHHLTMISKYDNNIKLRGDTFFIDNQNIYISDDFISINYGACKPKEIQESKLTRTQRAHIKGMSKWWNTHYEKWKKLNWIYSKEKSIDLKNSKYYNYILKINNLI